MKKVLRCLAILAVFAILFGCSGAPKEVTLDVKKTAEEIMTAGNMEGYTEMSLDELKELSFDETQVSAYAAYKGSEDEANYVFLFEVINEENINDVKYVGEKMQDKSIVAWTELKGDSFEIAKASRVITDGKYVLYLSVPNFDAAKEVFTKNFAK